MNTKQTIMTATIVGLTIGSLVPLLWGAGLTSFASVIFTAIGGCFGIYIGYKISR